MTVQHIRTTAPKDSADKNTLMREMIAKCSQSSITQELSVAHHNYEGRTRRWRWIRRRNNAHMVYSPFSTQEAPQEVKEQKRNEEEWRQKANLRLSAHCRHSDFANSSPGSKVWNTYDIILKPLFLARASIVLTQIDPFPMKKFTLQSACSYYCPPWSPHPHIRKKWYFP